jgi:hypothetical protein
VIARRDGSRAAFALALYAFAAGAPARAQDTGGGNEPPRLRLSLGVSGGPIVGLGVTANGQPIDEPKGDAVNPNATLGLDGSVVSWLALGVEGRIGGWSTQWSEAVGYADANMGGTKRFLVDLDAVMRFRSPIVRWFPRRPLLFSLSPFAGYSWPLAPSRSTRAVAERWTPLRGSNAGVELTCETWFTLRRLPLKWGVAVGLGYLRRWLALDEELTPVSQPDAAVTTRYHYVTDQLSFRLAAMAGF